MPKTIIPILASATALFIAGCADAEAVRPVATEGVPAVATEVPASVISETEALVWLMAPKGDFQEGWARLWEEDGSLFVDIDVTPPGAVAQPAHIHQGSCSQLGTINHRLENVISGKSLSRFPELSLSDVATGGLAVNLHLSFADFSTFTACGVIPALPASGQANAHQPLESDYEESGY